MLAFDFTNQFKKDLKLLKKRGKNMDKIMDIMVSLIWEEPLPALCREHILSGNYAGITECHIEGDWVMLYRRTDEKIGFYYTGTHSDYL